MTPLHDLRVYRAVHALRRRVRLVSLPARKNHLRERRDDQGLSQAALAEAVGVTRQTINATERERYDPSFGLAFELTAFFDCRIEDLSDPEIAE